MTQGQRVPVEEAQVEGVVIAMRAAVIDKHTREMQ